MPADAFAGSRPKPKAKTNSKAVQEIIDFRNRYIEAEENRDGAYMQKIFADDFYALNPQGSFWISPNRSPTCCGPTAPLD